MYICFKLYLWFLWSTSLILSQYHVLFLFCFVLFYCGLWCGFPWQGKSAILVIFFKLDLAQLFMDLYSTEILQKYTSKIFPGVPWWCSQLRIIVTAVAQLRSLAQEILHATGTAKKKKKKERKKKKKRKILLIFSGVSFNFQINFRINCSFKC